jgi:hypothetical protein
VNDQYSIINNPNYALFSDDRKHRYELVREWDKSNQRRSCFIGLNPSTANETDDDPTIRRVIGFAKSWGCGGVYMMNLFTFVTPDPGKLIKDDQWQDNKKRLIIRAMGCYASGGPVIFAWGSFREAVLRGDEIADVLGPIGCCLGNNGDGSPKHPLYIKGNMMPQGYKIGYGATLA